MRFLILQQGWAAAQNDAGDAQQELRAAVDFMGREVSLLGFGVPPGETALLKSDPDELEFLANLHRVVTVLAEKAAAGGKELSVASGSGFKQGRRVSVCSRVRCEWHALAEDGSRGRLEIEGGLEGDFPPGSTVHLVHRVGYAFRPDEAGRIRLLRHLDGGTQPLADRLVRAGFDYLDREGRAVDDPKRVHRVRVYLSIRPGKAPNLVRSLETGVYLRNGGGEDEMP
jgi:hypothetical protein